MKRFVLGFLLLACAETARADLILFDGTFNNSDWSAALLQNAGGTASFTAGQVPTGGNPGAYREVHHTYGGGNITVTHTYTPVTYDPATQGAIGSIDYSWDLWQDSPSVGPGAQVAYRVMVKQGGVFFGSEPQDLINNNATWRHFFRTGLVATDFERIVGPGPNNPDFSAAGGVLQFGYMSRNTNPIGGTSMRTSGVDNWSMTVHQATAAVPEPAALTLALLGLCVGAGWRWRRRELPEGS
jgi:hypothetical protein